MPNRDLVVSPQHRILIGGQKQLCEMFEREALAPAKGLTSLHGIRHMNGKRTVEWIHFACDRHEVVCANGCWSESLLLGKMALCATALDEQRTIARLFGGKPHDDPLNGPPALDLLRVGEVRSLLLQASEVQGH
ncbi:MAG: Hint domain-containing protein [Rhodobacter sp.]|nr:Hint domain-containing protein [Rhodobacter sp.]